MPFATDDLQRAYLAYQRFLARNPLPFHARYIFPFFNGTYFAYRTVDVKRIIAIAKSIANNPSYLDVGCGYGDFLKRIREFLPKAKGIEKDAGIFYGLAIPKPDYIEISDARWIDKRYDIIFVGWMEPGQDFRDSVARCATHCIITTFDAGGQCGKNGGCEYDEFGFEHIAWWRTPSWIDVNTELMNRYYTPSLDDEKKEQLTKLRTAHNFWYLYARPQIANILRSALRSWLDKEQLQENNGIKQKYDFEAVLDECGFGYMEELPALISNSSNNRQLWQVRFC